MPESALDVPDQSSFGTDFLPQQSAALGAPPSEAPLREGGFLSDAGYDPAKTQAVGAELAGQKREELGRQTYAEQEFNRQQSQDRQRMDEAYRLERASVNDPSLKPWNADKERAERISGPMEQFGSIGSVFAMAASLFTKTPMTSALNAGAAAMTAIKASDEKGYESAYQAWKDNSNLALKRFDMERNLFEDANKLADRDLKTWSAKRLAIAAQFEDRKAITLLENGMFQELLDLDTKKVTMASKLREQQQGFEEFDINRRLFSDGTKAYEESNPNATPEQKVQHRLQLLHDIKSGARSWQQEALRNFMMVNPSATPEQTQAFLQSLRGGGQGGGTGAQNLTTDRQRAGDIAKYREELKAEKNEDGSRKYTDQQVADMAADREKKLKMEATAPSANRRDQLASQITRFQVADQTIDKVEALLKKHSALTGLGGRITRPGEVVSNWFGSSETDRAQFRSYINELREMGPRLINESHSRPLSAEETKIASIIPGLDAGDTTVNTAKRLLELKKLFKTLNTDLTKRYEGNWTPEGAGDGKGSTAPAAPAGGDWWKKLPDKRTEMSADSGAA